MKIRAEALELAFRIVLSCPCDVSHAEELRVYAYLRGLSPGEVADYGPVLAACDTPDTPFHGLSDFTGWVADDVAEATIERTHVLRCNASGYHWQLAAATLPAQSRRVSSVSTFLLSHTVIPVSLGVGDDGSPRARYDYSGGATDFDHVFVPPEFDPTVAELWALHLGAVVSPLSPAEAALVSRLNEANAQLVGHRARVRRVDYADFELQGDDREFCRRRHAPFWGE
jgi:hypothetical protein